MKQPRLTTRERGPKPHPITLNAPTEPDPHDLARRCRGPFSQVRPEGTVTP
jgi:hypothetical protein